MGLIEWESVECGGQGKGSCGGVSPCTAALPCGADCGMAAGVAARAAARPIMTACQETWLRERRRNTRRGCLTLSLITKRMTTE